MAFKRPSATVLERMEADLARIKRQDEKIKVLASGEDTPFWKTVQRDLKGHLEDVERALDGYETLTDRQIVALLERRKMLRFFRDLPTGMARSLEKSADIRTKLEAKIAEYRSKLSRTR